MVHRIQQEHLLYYPGQRHQNYQMKVPQHWMELQLSLHWSLHAKQQFIFEPKLQTMQTK